MDFSLLLHANKGDISDLGLIHANMITNDSIQLALVVAVSDNQVIGKDNQLLWKLPNDMKFFKNTTWAMPVIMGRKTYESLGKPLTGRTNIIVTRQLDFTVPGTVVVHSLEAAIIIAKNTAAKVAYIIGGGEIYKEALPLAQTVYLTRVHTKVEGDTYFPELPSSQWNLFSTMPFEADEKHAFAYAFQIWKRKEDDSLLKE